MHLKSKSPSGVMFLLGCDSGKFDMPVSVGASLAEAFWVHPGGPICVVAATGETSPVTNYFIAKSMINQLKIRPDTVGLFVLGIQREIFREGNATFIELSKNNRHFKHLLQAVPAGETLSLRMPELLKNEVLVYNLIGDPSSKLKLPGHMALSVSTTEKGETILAGETPVECSKLVVETVALERECESFSKAAPIDERRVCFEKMNHRASVLRRQQSPGRNWSVLMSEPHKYIEKDHYLRLIAIGHEQSYIGIYDPAVDGPVN